MSFDLAKEAARKIVDLIADRQYDLAVQSCSISRLSKGDIGRVIDEYGRTFIHAPIEADRYLDVVEIEGRSVPTWSVRAPLWTREEGRSDLTLELTIAASPTNTDIELDDLKVL